MTIEQPRQNELFTFNPETGEVKIGWSKRQTKNLLAGAAKVITTFQEQLDEEIAAREDHSSPGTPSSRFAPRD